MAYCFLFSMVCLFLAALPDSAWARANTVGAVAGLYSLCLILARWARQEAWRQKVVVGSERVDMGFFGDDGHYFIPTYQGEGTWQWLLVGLPLVALLLFRLVRRERNAPMRRALKWLFFFYGTAVMYGVNNQWFPGPVAKPTFGNQALTAPPPPAAPNQVPASQDDI